MAAESAEGDGDPPPPISSDGLLCCFAPCYCGIRNLSRNLMLLALSAGLFALSEDEQLRQCDNKMIKLKTSLGEKDVFLQYPCNNPPIQH
jgi:hypothetical protein